MVRHGNLGLNTCSCRAAQVTLVVSASWFMAQIVPFFPDFVNLFGATLIPLISFMVPILLHRLCVHMKELRLAALLCGGSRG